eukprot:5971299-Alexandrium_andersonii.AAC.1
MANSQASETRGAQQASEVRGEGAGRSEGEVAKGFEGEELAWKHRQGGLSCASDLEAAACSGNALGPPCSRSARRAPQFSQGAPAARVVALEGGVWGSERR